MVCLLVHARVVWKVLGVQHHTLQPQPDARCYSGGDQKTPRQEPYWVAKSNNRSAEDLRASFGIAYSTLWVVMALLAMGLMERLVVMADSSQLMRRRPPLEAETGSGAEEPLTSYNGDFGELLARQQQYNLSPARQAHDKSGLSHQVTDLPGDVYDGTVPGSHSNLFEEAYAFWADTLGTSAIDDANDCSAAHDDQDSTGCSYCRQCVQCNRRKRQHNRRVVTVVVSPNSNGR